MVITDGFPFMKSGFLMKGLTKDVDVSEDGHGMVNYEVSLVRKNMRVSSIEHVIGGDESLPADVRLGSLKTAKEVLDKGGIHQLFHGYSFTLESFPPNRKKLIWCELPPQKGIRRFEIDIQRTCGGAKELNYGYGWSAPKMFGKPTSKGEFSSWMFIRHPVEVLTLRISFPKGYHLKMGPKILMYDINGNECSSQGKSKYEMPCDSINDLRLIQCFGKYYQVRIYNPRLGFTFKTVWKLR
ncbi:MAG: hypothetical protein ABII64_02440 [Elusimicrobiota bacterium]